MGRSAVRRLAPSDLSRRPSRRLNLWLVALALALLTGCQEEPVLLSNEPIRGETVWLSIDPIQCLGNPWEQAWLLTHDYADYPKSEAGRVAIFKDFYISQGLVIHTAEIERVSDGVRTCCRCWNGERYFILIDEADEGAFLDLGFERSDG